MRLRRDNTYGVQLHARRSGDVFGLPSDRRSGVWFISADRWAGHLAVIIPNHFGDRHALCDLTIGQVNRADWEVDLPPMCLRVSDDFVAGRRPFKTVVKGSLVTYEAFPEDHSYSKGSDWLEMEGLDETTSNVISRLIGEDA